MIGFIQIKKYELSYLQATDRVTDAGHTGTREFVRLCMNRGKRGIACHVIRKFVSERYERKHEIYFAYFEIVGLF